MDQCSLMDGSGVEGALAMESRCRLHGPHLAMSCVHGLEQVTSISLDSNLLSSEIRELNPCYELSQLSPLTLGIWEAPTHHL